MSSPPFRYINTLPRHRVYNFDLSTTNRRNTSTAKRGLTGPQLGLEKGLREHQFLTQMHAFSSLPLADLERLFMNIQFKIDRTQIRMRLGLGEHRNVA
jgi:hypothetical protein